MRGKETLLKPLPQTEERGLKTSAIASGLIDKKLRDTDRFQAVARGSQWMQAVKTAAQIPMQIPRRRGTLEGGEGFVFAFAVLPPVRRRRKLARLSIPFPCLGTAPLPPPVPLSLSLDRRGRAGGRAETARRQR